MSRIKKVDNCCEPSVSNKQETTIDLIIQTRLINYMAVISGANDYPEQMTGMAKHAVSVYCSDQRNRQVLAALLSVNTIEHTGGQSENYDCLTRGDV